MWREGGARLLVDYSRIRSYVSTRNACVMQQGVISLNRSQGVNVQHVTTTNVQLELQQIRGTSTDLFIYLFIL